MKTLSKISSSYARNNFGPIFRNTVVSLKPGQCVELGVLNGYSTVWMGLGLKHNAQFRYHEGHLDAYDIWEDYPYNHGSKGEVGKVLAEQGVDQYISLHHKDANEVHLLYEKDSIDLLHIDLSNTGDTFNSMVEKWHPLLRMMGVLMFEGGSVERDSIPWMVEAKASSIKKAIESNVIINSFYQYGTYDKFPSMSVFIKKGD